MDNLYDTGIRPAFDAYLLKKAKEVRDYGEYWSASSAGYCMRKNIFERLKVPHVETDADGRLQRVFLMGHKMHEAIQEITKEAGLSIASEVELIDDKLMIKGHFDDLIKTKYGLVLYDYKSVNSMSFKYKKDSMSHYHMMQLGTYLYMLNKLEAGDVIKWGDSSEGIIAELSNWKGVKEARILNVSKDDWRMSEVQLLWSPALEKMVYEYWSTLNGYWKNKQIPKCTCADYEINKKTGVGFMADPRFNPFYYNDEPCSIEWLKKCKEEGKVTW
jgi:hypothetical protein